MSMRTLDSIESGEVAGGDDIVVDCTVAAVSTAVAVAVCDFGSYQACLSAVTTAVEAISQCTNDIAAAISEATSESEACACACACACGCGCGG